MEMFECGFCGRKLRNNELGKDCPQCGAKYSGPFPLKIEQPIIFIVRDPKTGQENFLAYRNDNNDLIIAFGTSVEWAKTNHPKFKALLKKNGSEFELRAVRFGNPEVIVGPD